MVGALVVFVRFSNVAMNEAIVKQESIATVLLTTLEDTRSIACGRGRPRRGRPAAVRTALLTISTRYNKIVVRTVDRRKLRVVAGKHEACAVRGACDNLPDSVCPGRAASVH